MNTINIASRRELFFDHYLIDNLSGTARLKMHPPDGNPVPGLTLDDMEPIHGDRLDFAAQWKTNVDLAALAGQPVRLRFVIKDADIFAFRFQHRPGLDQPGTRLARRRLVQRGVRVSARTGWEKVALRFGAVDGICRIWLDGEQTGAQLEPPEVMWNRPFFVGAGKLTRGRTYRLVVRVAKESHGAGIWKLVGLIEQR